MYLTAAQRIRLGARARAEGVSEGEVIRRLLDGLSGCAAALLLEAVQAGDAGCSGLSRVEVEGGIRSAERAAVGRLFGSLKLEPVFDAVARRAGQHLRSQRSSHPGIDVTDYVIAATAELLGGELLTLNIEHFPMVVGLKPAFD
jgi:predicted nucleic acid-binding protein